MSNSCWSPSKSRKRKIDDFTGNLCEVKSGKVTLQMEG